MCIRDSNAEYMGKPTSTTARITQYRLQRIRAMNLLRVLGFIVMIHACFSLLQYRNYKGDIDDLRKIPLDVRLLLFTRIDIALFQILVELLAGFVINMLFGVLKYGDLKSIKAARLGKKYDFSQLVFRDSAFSSPQLRERLHKTKLQRLLQNTRRNPHESREGRDERSQTEQHLKRIISCKPSILFLLIEQI
eukprot:TRINITY_DN7544_c0_g1_i2.p1 TRINITY_DN7544_c0_g1~~TRINITY_DN7544_c0_g1_i2.p1  ORF type:complete len:192 (+),score=22.18 TRINITY_DN7544_c0_g1_i2:64-639(+)